jgi:DHA2 family multidrug resistance protein
VSGVAAAPPPDGEKADASAWLAVAAGTIGALMATLDTSIVNSALPTIQGEIGASGAEGTWISTAYLVAEIIMIPLAGWLERIFGLRTFLLIATTAFTLFSMWCGISQDLPHMVIGRIGQGFFGGAMIPTALTIVGTRLPPAQRPLGIALFGMTAVLGPVLGPVLGGWLTENISWHYAFFMNLPIGIGLIALVTIGLPGRKAKFDEFLSTDVPGIAGLVLGLGGLTVVLEEGQRERWFESSMICELSVVSVLGIGLLILGQFVSKKPVIQLKILLTRAFGGVFVMSLMVGAALYGILYIIPQFLTAVSGYNAQQSGEIAALSGVPTIMLLAVFPILVRVIDIRIAVAFGFILYGVSCFMDIHLSPVAAGPQFVDSQILRGIAQFFAMLFLNQAATSAVAQDLVEDASGLFNAARNLGGSFGLAMVATLQDQRQTFHEARIAESLPANSIVVQTATHTLGLARLNQDIVSQATVMTYSDLYWVFGVGMFALIPLVLLLKPLPKGADLHVGG